VVAVAVLVVVVAAAGAAWWWLEREDVTTTSGSCGDARYQLQAETEDGQVEVSFELTTRAPGEEWVVTIRQGEQVLAEGERLSDEDAEVDLDARVADDGRRTFVAEATPEAGGPPCRAEVTHG